MKRKKCKLTERIISIALCVCMVSSLMPSYALTAHAAEVVSDTTGLCEHHTEHNAECGYVEAVEGTPCNYVCELCTDDNNAEQQENEIAECTCGTDDDSIHATNCALYVAPENPVCSCVEKCTEDTFNVWCDVCGSDYIACTGTEEATVYEDTTVCTTHTFEGGVCTNCNITGGYCGANTNTGGEKSVTWTLKDGTFTISGIGAMADYTYSFSSTGSTDAPWYANRYSIQTVTITGEITKIGECAFFECKNLTSITIPDSVKSIEYGAFYECDSLTSIEIPDSVTSIGIYAFERSGLTNINIPNGVTSISRATFSDCSALTTITIPDSVTSIEQSAFYACRSLTTITIPDSVTSIGERAFRNCEGLISITIPDSVTSIGKWAFLDCTALKSITIPDSVTSIGEYAFMNCDNLTTLNASCKWKSDIESGDFYDLDISQLENITYTHPMKYSATGNELYGDCSNSCGELETITATLSVAPNADLSYTGSAVKPELIMTYPDNWVGEKIQPTTDNCTYSNNINVGTATGTFTYEEGCVLTLNFTINKAKNAPNMPGNTMSAPYSNKTVGALTLPEGWAWQDADKNTALEVGVSVEATAVYTGTDKGNYENESVVITITRCEPEVGKEITSEDGSAIYTVTETGENGNAVTYEAPTDKKCNNRGYSSNCYD